MSFCSTFNFSRQVAVVLIAVTLAGQGINLQQNYQIVTNVSEAGSQLEIRRQGEY